MATIKPAKKPAPVKAKAATRAVAKAAATSAGAKRNGSMISAAARKPSPKPSTPVAAKSAARPAPPAKPALAAAKPAARPVAMTPPLVPAVKPKRKGAGLGVRDLQRFTDLLLEKRREIVGDMHSMEGEALRSGSNGLSNLPVHMADMGTDNYEQEFTLGLVEKDRHLLREINHALAKIPAGTFGICEGTNEPIGKPRLEVQPWARHSIEYARLRERNGRGVRGPM